MLEIERHLIEGRPPKYVQIPTAAAPEGPAVLARWTRLGAEQAERLGVEAVPLVVHDRAEADDPGIAEQVAGRAWCTCPVGTQHTWLGRFATPRSGPRSWPPGAAGLPWRDAARARWP